MSRRVSPSTDQVYGLQRVTRIWGVSRATVYRHRQQPEAIARRRPGPLAAMADEELVRAIRQLLQDSPFHGEGYRKLWARLRFAGIRTSRRRVLRLMREHGLLAHQRAGRPRGSRAHDGHHHRAGRSHVGHRPDVGHDGRGPGGGVHYGRSLLGRVRRPPGQPQRRSLRGAQRRQGVRERFDSIAKNGINFLRGMAPRSVFRRGRSCSLGCTSTATASLAVSAASRAMGRSLRAASRPLPRC